MTLGFVGVVPNQGSIMPMALRSASEASCAVISMSLSETGLVA